jgi:hypothetical protein
MNIWYKAYCFLQNALLGQGLTCFYNETSKTSGEKFSFASFSYSQFQKQASSHSIGWRLCTFYQRFLRIKTAFKRDQNTPNKSDLGGKLAHSVRQK